MATAQTLSPTADGTCILKPSNTDSVIDASMKREFGRDCNEQPGFTSAPEISLSEEGANLVQHHIGKHGNRKRRKRRNSFNENSASSTAGLANQNGKRRRGASGHHKRHTSSSGIILPTKFLLGGNINDPLNLNSMMDENVNRALNAVTPSSSPLPPRNSVIDIVTPNDVTDPLGLNSGNFASPTSVSRQQQRNRSKRSRRRRSNVTRQQEQQQNSDGASNSDDQKNVHREASNEKPDVSHGETQGKTSTQNKKTRQSPPAVLGHLSVPTSHAQVHIRDPIVSPAIPQHTRRSKMASGSKHRRRKHGGKPDTNDAGIQTDTMEMLDEKLRCVSEKIPERSSFSPVKRRRTYSENLTSTFRWDNVDIIEDRRNRRFFPEEVPSSLKSDSKELNILLPKPIGTSFKSDAVEASDRSPAQNYMNQEKKSPQKLPTPCIGEQDNTGAKCKNEVEVSSNEIAKKESSTAVPENSSRTKSKRRPYTAKFQYGNYSQYYGYRNPEKFKDVRMECLKKEWFKEKDVLDIGCNAGHLTLLIARDYEPRKIVGIDIDDNLIRMARNNVRHYASTSKSGKCVAKFPASMAISLGPLASPPVETGKDDTTASFPNNVNFFQGNYVPKKDEFLRFQEPEYDIIMCMSVSKWVHLNWKDEGLIRMFRRIFKQLRAGGMFILEPQQWSSYSAKRKMCEQLNENYQTIRIRPESFPNLLLRDIGFERVEYLTMQKTNKSKGFQRPIQVYYKPE